MNFDAIDKVSSKFITKHDIGITVYTAEETTDELGRYSIKTNVEVKLTKENIDQYVNRFMKIKAKRYNPLLAQLYLNEAYDIEYDLYNHDDPALAHPFQQHLMTDKKKIKKHGQFQYYLHRYHSHQIQKYFGISFLEFINLPLDKIDDMYEMTFQWLEEEMREVDKLNSKLDKVNQQGENQINQIQD